CCQFIPVRAVRHLMKPSRGAKRHNYTMANCISLSENFRPSPAAVPSASDMRRKWRLVSHRTIKAQTCYVTVFTPYSSRCSPASRLLFGNLTGDVSTLFISSATAGFQDSDIRYLLYILTLPGLCSTF
uniref:Uncharacterized protein n=1 Tax=Dicentrarchus labrax TaxID=13489 RepID=A0A8C4IN16_DICLA